MPEVDRGHLAQLAISAAGVWLMASPDVLGYGDPFATSNYVVGPLLVTLGGIGVWELNREIRLAAIPIGVYLLAAPWIFGAPTDATVSNMLVGTLVALLALVRGNPAPAFGGGWSSLWQSPSPYHDRPEAADPQDRTEGNE